MAEPKKDCDTMAEYNFEELKKVAKASSEALEHSRSAVKDGRTLLEVAEEIESFIKNKGYALAFPVNISINEIAAHYTPGCDDTSVFEKGDVVKIDLGARKGFYLGDCAITIDLSEGEHEKMIHAAEEALEAATSLVKAGRKVCEIGREIESVSKKYGFIPVKNLGGHCIEEEELHASIFIPNYDNGDQTMLEEGQIISIEPFLTNGAGFVKETENVGIFQKGGDIRPRLPATREIVEYIDKNYLTYPFAMRWLEQSFDGFKARRAISELLGGGVLEEFPVLVEEKGGIVVQAEKEFIVEKDSCTVLTR